MGRDGAQNRIRIVASKTMASHEPDDDCNRWRWSSKLANWDLVTTKTMAYGEPDDDRNGNDDGQDNKLNFHVLKPHLPPELLPLPLENISLPNQQPSPSLHETTERLHSQEILARTQHDKTTTPSKSEQKKRGG